MSRGRQARSPAPGGSPGTPGAGDDQVAWVPIVLARPSDPIAVGGRAAGVAGVRARRRGRGTRPGSHTGPNTPPRDRPRHRRHRSATPFTERAAPGPRPVVRRRGHREGSQAPLPGARVARPRRACPPTGTLLQQAAKRSTIPANDRDRCERRARRGVRRRRTGLSGSGRRPRRSCRGPAGFHS